MGGFQWFDLLMTFFIGSVWVSSASETVIIMFAIWPQRSLKGIVEIIYGIGHKNCYGLLPRKSINNAIHAALRIATP